MLISHRRSLKFSPLCMIVSFLIAKVLNCTSHVPRLRPSPASPGEQSPHRYLDPTTVEPLPESIPLPQSSTTQTSTGDEVEILPPNARWIDTELSRGLDTLKDDAGWKIRQDSTTTLLPPPTPDMFTHIPKRFLIGRALSETSLQEQAAQDRDFYCNNYHTLFQENSALRGKDTEIQGLNKQLGDCKDMVNRTCRESFLARDNVWVVVRIRDPISTDDGEPLLQFSSDGRTMQLPPPRQQDPTRRFEGTITSKSFTFDCVFRPPISNRRVFEKVEPLTQAALSGYNLCIIADGQSGSGKSYTMMNGPGAIATSAVTSIFAELQGSTYLDYKASVSCSILEMYRDRPRDLLGDKDFHIPQEPGAPLGCSEHNLYTADDLVALMRTASTQRTDRSTRQNISSSRSDLVIIITIIQRYVTPTKTLDSHLVLIDLAGSESLSSSSHEHIEEVKIIKKGRESLQRMMIAYQESQELHPDTKLTRLLKRYCGTQSQSRIVVLATASPLHKDRKATQATLDFAHRIRNGAVKPSGNRKP